MTLAASSLFDILANRIEVIDPFSKNSPNFLTLQTLIHQKQPLDLDFAKNPHFISHLQFHLLACLSMAGGPFSSHIRHLSQKEGIVSLVWQTGIKDRFSWGIADEHFFKFLSSFSEKILQQKLKSSQLHLGLYLDLIPFFNAFLSILSPSYQQLSLLTSKEACLFYLQDEGVQLKPSGFIFSTLLSNLDIQDLNVFFIQLHPHLPKELDIKSKEGHYLSLASILEKSSTDPLFLLEKVRLLFELYHHPKLQNLKNIIHLKSLESLRLIFQNPHSFNGFKKNLDTVIKTHYASRIELYTLLSQHLESLSSPLSY